MTVDGSLEFATVVFSAPVDAADFSPGQIQIWNSEFGGNWSNLNAATQVDPVTVEFDTIGDFGSTPTSGSPWRTLAGPAYLIVPEFGGIT